MPARHDVEVPRPSLPRGLQRRRFSIGSNDLIQYVAARRDEPQLVISAVLARGVRSDWHVVNYATAAPDEPVGDLQATDKVAAFLDKVCAPFRWHPDARL